MNKSNSTDKIINPTLLTTEKIKPLFGTHTLLVEDDPINQELILSILSDTGTIIDIANNGKEAIDLFKKNNYQCILMDIHMPIMNGYEASRIIREKNKIIPIIALTANSTNEEIKKSKSAGINESLCKPIAVEQLKSLLIKYITIDKDKENANTTSLNKRSEQEIDQVQPVDENSINKYKHIDTTSGLSTCCGDKKLYLSILKIFKSTYTNLKIDKLDDQKFKLTIHTIKGQSANIGASRLYLISIKIDDTQDRLLLPNFKHELNKVLIDIEKIIQQQIKVDEANTIIPTKRLINKQQRDKLFTALRDSAKTRRPQKCKIIIEQIQMYQLSDKDHNIFIEAFNLSSKYLYKELYQLMENTV